MSRQQPDASDEDYKVALIVFATVGRSDVRDQREAGVRAVQALRQALDAVDAGLDPELPTIPATDDVLPTIHVTTYGVMDTAEAGINAYLVTVPTSRAYARPAPPGDGEVPPVNR
jgi:hypothetical protein